jgi:hypothetical protein
MVAETAGSTHELWARYDGAGRMTLTLALALAALLLLTAALRSRRAFRPPAFDRRLVVGLVTLWPISIVSFLIALTVYARQMSHDYPGFVAPQSPVLPITLAAAAVTFIVVACTGSAEGQHRLIGALMAAAAAPMVFELPFDLMVMARTTPPVLPDPGWWRALFFMPLFAVELITITLLLAVPGVQVTRWTYAALAALFLAFALWASIGLGYPDHTLPYAGNIVAKLCAFAVTLSTLLPFGREPTTLAAPSPEPTPTS